MMDHPIILDTHAWLWILSGEKKISQKCAEFVQKKRDFNELYLSDISLWEVSMLAKKGRITLGQPTLNWLKHAIKNSAVQLIHITPEISVESTELPGNFHGDPADRLIVSTARILNLTIITRDEKILEYSSENRVHALTI